MVKRGDAGSRGERLRREGRGLRVKETRERGARV